MTESGSLCEARVAGAQGGFCRNEVVPGSRYCEAHDWPLGNPADEVTWDEIVEIMESSE